MYNMVPSWLLIVKTCCITSLIENFLLIYFLYRDCLAFCTEPVCASLANVLGSWDNLPSPVPSDIKEYKLYDVETKYGLLQVWHFYFYYFHVLLLLMVVL